MRTSNTIAELAKALVAAQGAIKPAIRDKANPFFKSRYADLAGVFDACRAALAEQGVVVMQAASAEGAAGNRVTVTTRLLHVSGEWMEEDLSATAKDDGPQAVGSAVTYLRRYGLATMAGVATEDDDGEAAEDRNRSRSGVDRVKERLRAVPKDVDDYIQRLTQCETGEAIDTLVRASRTLLDGLNEGDLERARTCTQERRGEVG